jgi:hypothetical protein
MLRTHGQKGVTSSTEVYYGTLCKRGHRAGDTNTSLRYKGDGKCVACHSENQCGKGKMKPIELSDHTLLHISQSPRKELVIQLDLFDELQT